MHVAHQCEGQSARQRHCEWRKFYASYAWAVMLGPVHVERYLRFMTMRDIDAWLFDLGNVVVGIDFDLAFKHWARTASCSADDLRARFHFDEAYERHERGEITATEYFAVLRKALAVDLSDEELTDGWNAIYTGAIDAVVAQLPAMARCRPLYAFTNTNLCHHAVWSPLHAQDLQHFEHIFLSCHLGLRKPEAAAFAAVARHINVPMEKILFFDDTEENVVGARAVGMPAVWVRSPSDVIEAVAPYLESDDE